MKLQVTPIRLNQDLTLAHEDSLVKQGALTAFKAVRFLMAQSKKAPSLLQQAVVDVREAWEESSFPKV
jgi:hypothetical protein